MRDVSGICRLTVAVLLMTSLDAFCQQIPNLPSTNNGQFANGFPGQGTNTSNNPNAVNDALNELFPTEKTDSTQSTRDRKVKRYRYADSIHVYKIIDYARDTSYVDTSLNINKYYQLTDRRKDSFGLMPYPNLGENYTPLIYDGKISLTPEYGFKSRSYFYRTAQDIDYYNVRTPWSEVMYLTSVFGNFRGQVLDFKFTVNLNELTNISVAFRGTRTFGDYAYSAAKHGELVATANTRSYDYKYLMRAHVAYQYLGNTENGGLTDQGIAYFKENNPEFTFRSTLPTNLSTLNDEVVNRLAGTRVFLQQSYDIFNSSVKRPNAFRISILNEIQWQQQNYKYYDPAFKSQTSEAGARSLKYYGSPLFSSPITIDSSYYRNFHIKAGVGLNIPLINLYAEGNIRLESAKYKLTSDKVIDGVLHPGELSGTTYGVDLLARWRPLKYFGADFKFDYNLGGLFSDARKMEASAYLQLNAKNRLEGTYTNASYYAPMTTRMYTSNYVNFNWNNSFERIGHNQIKLTLKSQILNAGASMVNISNYVYYGTDRLPKQYGGNVNFFSIYANKDLRIRFFGWDNSVIYQKVTSGAEVLPMPEIIIRSSVYFTVKLFRRALYLMTGINGYYYTGFNAPYYNPLVSDYNLQEGNHTIGNYVVITPFISAKIRNTRIFIKYENANSWLGNYNYWSGANQPYMDATLRFGLVWDWFN